MITVFQGDVTNEVWTSGIAIICTDAQPVTVQVVIANSVTRALDLVDGQQYTITNPGDTDFTLIGSADNNIGTTFTADNSVNPFVGTGTATSTVIDNMYVDKVLTATPRQIPANAETRVHVGKGNQLTTVGAGTYTILVGN